MRILTIGSFDILHHGHLRLFERCAQLGELHVGVNSDHWIHRYKGRLPAEDQDARMLSVMEASGVKKVYLNDGPGIDLIREVRPDILVVGSDWWENDYTGQIHTNEEELFEDLGLSVLFVPRTPGVSSTQIREQRAGEAQL